MHLLHQEEMPEMNKNYGFFRVVQCVLAFHRGGGSNMKPKWMLTLCLSPEGTKDQAKEVTGRIFPFVSPTHDGSWRWIRDLLISEPKMHIHPQKKWTLWTSTISQSKRNMFFQTSMTFGFHILIFQGVIKLLVVGLYALQRRSLASKFQEKNTNPHEILKRIMLTNLMMVNNPSIRPPISWGELRWVVLGGVLPQTSRMLPTPAVGMRSRLDITAFLPVVNQKWQRMFWFGALFICKSYPKCWTIGHHFGQKVVWKSFGQSKSFRDL